MSEVQRKGRVQREEALRFLDTLRCTWNDRAWVAPFGMMVVMQGFSPGEDTSVTLLPRPISL